jgi:hypothetical protein
MGVLTDAPFYRIAGSLLAKPCLGLLIEGGIDGIKAGFLCHGFDAPPHRWTHKKGHFLKFGFGVWMPIHRADQQRFFE